MSTIDPETIDVTQPPAVNPTTSGLRAVVAAIKALFATAKAEVEDLDSRVTALEEGGGGSYQDFDLGPLASYESAVIEHNPIPLTGEGAFDFHVQAQATLPGASMTVNHPSPDYGEDGFDIPNVSWFEEGITWTNDGVVEGYTTGHFSKALGEPVRRGCYFGVAGSEVEGGICVWSGDGTGYQSVVVSEDVPSGTVDLMVGLDQSYYSGIYLRSVYYDDQSLYPNLNDHLAPVKAAMAFDVSAANIGAWTYPPRGYTYYSEWGVGWAQCFWSKNGGQTWWGWDQQAEDWLEGVDPGSVQDRVNHGFRFPSGYYQTMERIAGGSWGDMTLEEWQSWAADADSILAYCWLQTTDYRYGVNLYGIYLGYDEADYQAQLGVGAETSDEYGGGSSQLETKRLSETQLEVTNTSNVDLIDLRLRLVTG